MLSKQRKHSIAPSLITAYWPNHLLKNVLKPSFYWSIPTTGEAIKIIIVEAFVKPETYPCVLAGSVTQTNFFHGHYTRLVKNPRKIKYSWRILQYSSHIP